MTAYADTATTSTFVAGCELGGKVAERNFGPVGSVVDDDMDWDLEGMRTTKRVEKTGLCDQTREF